MKCLNCEETNEKEDVYCSNCGKKLVVENHPNVSVHVYAALILLILGSAFILSGFFPEGGITELLEANKDEAGVFEVSPDRISWHMVDDHLLGHFTPRWASVEESPVIINIKAYDLNESDTYLLRINKTYNLVAFPLYSDYMPENATLLTAVYIDNAVNFTHDFTVIGIKAVDKVVMELLRIDLTDFSVELISKITLLYVEV